MSSAEHHIDNLTVDAVVVGGGHNGLIAAAYLARAGVATLLVEARDQVGGCASTVTDLGARFNICNCDHTMIRALPIIDDLDLARHGLRYLESEFSSIHSTYALDDTWVFRHNVDEHLDTMAVTHPQWVKSYQRYLDDAIPVAKLVLEMARSTPSGMHFLQGLATVKGRGARRLLAWSQKSALDVFQTYFTDWRAWMPAVVTGPTVWGVHPATPGTGLAGALYATKHLIRTARPEGGSGALTDAIERSFLAAGGRTLTGSRVTKLLTKHQRVHGVQLADGRFIEARHVLVSSDPQQIFTRWLDDSTANTFPEIVKWRQQEAHDGYESKLDVVLEGLPVYKFERQLRSVVGESDLHSPTTVVSPSPSDLDEAHRRRAEAKVADHPSLLINIPTNLDHSMQLDPNEHVLSLEVLFTPYQHDWERSTEPERWLQILDSLCEPGTLNVKRWRAMTPDRYESEFFMPRGHTPAFSGSPWSTLKGTPKDLTRHSGPIDGLHLAGAAAFPGAGIFGGAGRNAAHRVLNQMRQ
ncbi:MAG: NAD(P)/FAD-dependent oxidoreductase [Actinobacteria bacterium]|nr:NAD(P)/FAD-dependent oxidoreductase [Ilumatobacteraceae bacterium]MDA0299172.1 NAD(P)/FAD-dependent oxidoreductase [Actinomycetota bacterium]MDA2961201.1 NAD(P)/FAD-dependent oxidoreductase [Actinomycetota bacterium]MDA2994104.1 NAD(P)/FAD-dependent oxidoreductase [Actinomycetota bacterium]